MVDVLGWVGLGWVRGAMSFKTGFAYSSATNEFSKSHQFSLFPVHRFKFGTYHGDGFLLVVSQRGH